MENGLSPRTYNAAARAAVAARTLVNIHRLGRCTSSPAIRRRPVRLSNVEPHYPAKRLRKERGPNWQPNEMSALIMAKRNLFLEELDTIDGRDLMQPDAGKWLRISAEVMKVGSSPCLRDGPACKSKWNQLIPEYKRIADFLAWSGTNDLLYWTLTTADRKAEGLPRSFPQHVFFRIHNWYGSRPAMQPPHSRDLMSPHDSNYKTPATGSENEDTLFVSDDESEDPFDVADTVQDSGDRMASTQSPSAGVSNAKATACLGLPRPSLSGSPSILPKGSVPPGVTTHLLSSSKTADASVGRRPGNTAARRKSVSGHSLIAEATRATGNAMVGQMKEMAEASRELERSKIDVQLRLFTEQMDYQRERDRRLHENARLSNENAKLAILKQGEVVQCLADLSGVFSAGLQLRHGGDPARSTFNASSAPLSTPPTCTEGPSPVPQSDDRDTEHSQD